MSVALPRMREVVGFTELLKVKQLRVGRFCVAWTETLNGSQGMRENTARETLKEGSWRIQSYGKEAMKQRLFMGSLSLPLRISVFHCLFFIQATFKSVTISTSSFPGRHKRERDNRKEWGLTNRHGSEDKERSATLIHSKVKHRLVGNVCCIWRWLGVQPGHTHTHWEQQAKLASVYGGTRVFSVPTVPLLIAWQQRALGQMSESPSLPPFFYCGQIQPSAVRQHPNVMWWDEMLMVWAPLLTG